MKFLIIDNYDSFVYNIAQRLGELGITSDVIRNDMIRIEKNLRAKKVRYNGASQIVKDIILDYEKN